MKRHASLVILSAIILLNLSQCFIFPDATKEGSDETSEESSIENTQKEISCESVIEGQWGGEVVANLQTCWISKETSIRSLGTRITTQSDDISAAEPTEALMLSNNKKLFFLPIGLDESFNSLIAYSARNCSLKAIVKKNFMKLVDLQLLWLDENFIDTVPGDTFEDLKSLRWLDISKNRINSINGEAFRLLLKLDQVSLIGNKCINEGFKGFQLSRLRRAVNENCSFNEKTVCQNLNDRKNVDDLFNEQTKNLTTIFNKSFGERIKFQTEVARLTAENYQQKIRLGSLDAKLTSAQTQIISQEEVFEKLKAHFKDLYEQQITSLQDNLELKQKENDRLLDENQNQKDSMKEKEKRIEFLQNKLNDLTA